MALVAWALGGCSAVAQPAPSTLLDPVDASVVQPDAAAPIADAAKPDAADASSVDAPACVLAVSVPNPACGTCLQSNCCNVANTCLGDPDCAALVDCLAACNPDSGSDGGDVTACNLTCTKLHHASAAAAAQLDACERQSCANACP